MSTQEVAEAMNAYLWAEHLKTPGSPQPTILDHRFVSGYENGRFWWPSRHYRAAFRHVLRATDAELGFRRSRRRAGLPTDTVAPQVTDALVDGADMRWPENANSQRRALMMGATAWATGLASTPQALIRIAAHESAQLGSDHEESPMAVGTLDSLREDLHRLTTDYVITSDLPRILTEALDLRDRISTTIGHRRLRLRELRDAYVMMGAVCLLLGSISHDFGESTAGMMQADAAQVWAELAELPELHGWVLCTKAMIDLWRGRPYDVLRHAAQGARLPATSTARARLVGLEIRALAQVRRAPEAVTLLRRAQEGDSTGALQDLGSMFSFPTSRRHYYAAVSYAQLGDLAATEQLVAHLGHDDSPPTTAGVWPISWALSRSYLALARLDHPGDNGGPDAALHALTPVLSLPDVQRINQLGQVLADIDQRVSAPILATTASGRALREAIRTFRPVPTPEIMTT